METVDTKKDESSTIQDCELSQLTNSIFVPDNKKKKIAIHMALYVSTNNVMV